MNKLLKSNIALTDFSEFPKMTIKQNGGIDFKHYSKHDSALDIVKNKQEFFQMRLAIAEERVFSTGEYIRAKLNYSDEEKLTKTVVHNVHSVLGSSERKWVLGFLSQREDGMFYLEDSTYAI